MIKGTFHHDRHGLPVQANGDGGDSAHHFGVKLLGIAIYRINEWSYDFLPYISTDEISYALKSLYDNAGNFRRNPDYKGWKWSRDQERGAIIGMGEYGFPNEVKDAFEKRKLFFPNGDIFTPEDSAIYFRALDLQYDVFRYFGDFLTLINSLIICFWKSRDPDNVGDDLNHTMILLQQTLWRPTFISKCAKWIYVKYRKASYGTTKLGEKNHILGAWKWYFRPETGASPWDEFMKPVIEKYLLGVKK